ncbi:hypothetical protein [Salinibacillus xinjiangensis]|uniref:Type 4a pilus biogenesis protein PilO n=1 Tax=Salinibacillus xinjiangensis TaxID=1229268 RepID=A0A6G1X9N5_9BACI|nr:hypothetical protein [Salinibacillus xinjiangensis]MRG87498.1 hypothetical protein [Salinibacillus xinjiangensis]
MNKIQKVILSVSTLVFVLGVVFAYFIMVRPLQQELERVEGSLSTEKLVLKKLQERINENEDMDITAESIALQRQLPLIPNHEQIFVELNEAEDISDSVITNYTISDPIAAAFPDQEEDVEGLQSFTYDISVEAQTYEDMLTFIEYLEGNERILSIDFVSFSEPDEENILTYEMTLTAFYTENFDGLRDIQPSIDIPKPANKTNPLP